MKFAFSKKWVDILFCNLELLVVELCTDSKMTCAFFGTVVFAVWWP
jgi:hypothetical protein